VVTQKGALGQINALLVGKAQGCGHEEAEEASPARMDNELGMPIEQATQQGSAGARDAADEHGAILNGWNWMHARSDWLAVEISLLARRMGRLGPRPARIRDE
jgi:hypothetical protein